VTGSSFCSGIGQGFCRSIYKVLERAALFLAYRRTEVRRTDPAQTGDVVGSMDWRRPDWGRTTALASVNLPRLGIALLFMGAYALGM